MRSDTEVLIVRRWPDIPGHTGGVEFTTARRRAVSEDNRWWLVKPRGWFRRARWMPRRGQFVSLYLVSTEMREWAEREHG